MDRIGRDWDHVTTALDDLASLAEAVEDDRLDNYTELDAAYQRITRVFDLARTVVQVEDRIRSGDSGFEQVEAIEELAEVFGIQLRELS